MLILCFVFMILAFVVPYVYFSVNVEDAISQEGGVCYGLKFVGISEMDPVLFSLH